MHICIYSKYITCVYRCIYIQHVHLYTYIYNIRICIIYIICAYVFIYVYIYIYIWGGPKNGVSKGYPQITMVGLV